MISVSVVLARLCRSGEWQIIAADGPRLRSLMKYRRSLQFSPILRMCSQHLLNRKAKNPRCLAKSTGRLARFLNLLDREGRIFAQLGPELLAQPRALPSTSLYERNSFALSASSTKLDPPVCHDREAAPLFRTAFNLS